MPKQIKTMSRRNFLKGAVYTSALSMGGLSMGGLSGAALASSVTPNQFIVTESTSAAVTLMNQTAKPVALDATQPVSIEKINGWMVVKVNKATDTGSAQILNLEAGQELPLSIDAELAPMMVNNKQQSVMHRTIFVGNDNFPASLYHPTFA